jgi:Uma2 family endonuclease
MTQTLASPPVAAAEQTRLSEEEILDALEQDAALEFVDETFVEKPVSALSSEVALTIATRLNIAAGFGKLGRTYGTDLIYRCWPNRPRHYRKPDASFVRTERLADVPRTTRIFTFAPDLCVEVLSPNDNAYAVSEKIDEYREAAFPLIWVIQPERKICMIYEDGGIREARADDVLELPGLLPEFRHTLGELIG